MYTKPTLKQYSNTQPEQMVLCEWKLHLQFSSKACLFDNRPNNHPFCCTNSDVWAAVKAEYHSNEVSARNVSGQTYIGFGALETKLSSVELDLHYLSSKLVWHSNKGERVVVSAMQHAACTNNASRRCHWDSELGQRMRTRPSYVTLRQ